MGEVAKPWGRLPRSWGALRAEFRDAGFYRSWTIDANDGVIATAGLLFGFAGAGASNRLLLFTAAAATIAGGLSVGGAAWAEASAERDAQLLRREQEEADLVADPDGELAELAQHWEARGLSPELADEVARQLTAHDALGAQLEWEYDFRSPMPVALPIWFAVGAAASYVVGAVVPLLITYVAPVQVERWVILAAVVTTLVLSSLVAARAGQLMPRRMLARTLVVGVITMIVSYGAGELLI